MPNQKSATRLSANILNYFAAFTETRFNFRTLINYRWTNNELTLDLGIFQGFQNGLLQRIKTGDSTPLTVKNNEHVLSLSGDEVLLEINKALSDKFGLEYLKSCIEQEIQKQNSQTFLDGCRKYNLSLRKQIEIILIELQRKQIDRLKDELGIEHVPASTFNSANYLKKHFDALQSIARETRSQEEYISSVKQYFKEDIDDIVLYDLFISIQKYARYNTVGTIYLFFHELNRRTNDNTVEGYPIFFIELNLSPGAEKVEVLFPRDLLLIDTPAVNYFKFPSVLTTSRSSTLKNAASNLGGMEVFLQAQYGWNEPFVLEPGEKEVRNPQIVAAFRRLGLCEQAGTGMRMVLNQWQALGHPEPEYDNDRSRKTFEIRLSLKQNQVTGEVTPPVSEQVAGEVTGEVTGEVQKFLKILHTPMSRSEAQIALNLKGQANFRDRYLKPALDLELVEMTILDKPKSRLQKYRLTEKGKAWLDKYIGKGK